MTLTVQLFARARELAGNDTVAVALPDGSTVADLRRAIASRFPVFASLLTVSRLAVNHDFADDAHVLQPGDEVAVIPPVSGG